MFLYLFKISRVYASYELNLKNWQNWQLSPQGAALKEHLKIIRRSGKYFIRAYQII